jgi:hypothetical protein
LNKRAKLYGKFAKNKLNLFKRSKSYQLHINQTSNPTTASASTKGTKEDKIIENRKTNAKSTQTETIQLQKAYVMVKLNNQ